MSKSVSVAEADVIPAEEEPRVVPKSRERNKTRPKKQPPYAVIVENDACHTWAYVIEVLERICGHGEQMAYLLTAEVHYRGRALVWSGALEVAELKRDQIRGYGPDDYASKRVTFPLGVTIEPLPGD